MVPSATGCVVDAAGASVCLPDLAGVEQRLTAPTTAAECGSEEAALTLLASPQYDATAAGGAAAGAVAAPKDADAGDEAAAVSPLDAFIIQSAQRHWWAAAKNAVVLCPTCREPIGARVAEMGAHVGEAPTFVMPAKR